MKKSLKKAILTCMAVSAMLVAMSATAMAATYNSTTNTVSIDADLTAQEGKQVTVLVLKPGTVDTAVTATDISYINQEAAATTTFKTMPMQTGLANGTYTVKIGGESMESIITETFTVGSTTPTYTLGDVNNDGRVKVNDFTMVIDYVLGADLTDTQVLAADTNKDGRVKVNDGTDIVDYVLGYPSYVDGSKI